nr:MarR family winged helix-turn-helix transcriptional regulator [uncultured Pseudodesulfovibrio sp.]
MTEFRKSYEKMQHALLELVETVNAHHRGGVDFGTGQRLHPAEIHTVAAIGDEPKITVTKLAERLSVSKPTISERISKLMKKGLVKKGTKPDDAKAVTLLLTKNGWTAYSHHEAHHDKMFKNFVSQYGDKSEIMAQQLGEALCEMQKLAEMSDCHNN